VIGRYREGRFEIYGSYYLRWWFVDICRKLFLRGIWNSHDKLLRFYYRLLGANIGNGARISTEADIAEYDLVTIGDKASIENSTVRAFGVDNGAMILGSVRVGHFSSLGIRSVVAPFTQVPDGKHLGPLVSTYDDSPGKAISDQHARVNRQCFPKPSMALQIFLGGPISLFVSTFSQIPPLLILYQLLLFKSRESDDVSSLYRWNSGSACSMIHVQNHTNFFFSTFSRTGTNLLTGFATLVVSPFSSEFGWHERSFHHSSTCLRPCLSSGLWWENSSQGHAKRIVISITSAIGWSHDCSLVPDFKSAQT